MYLKSIKAHGFKSFADVTEIEVKKGITGVVGPNGSGKSNIVDAVKWVLGEQSVKALRGTNQMSDVIFSGSKSRKMMSRAYVALTFDNTDHYLNTEFDTVEIKRVLYKTGENDFFINNNKVRLKDITDLFIDSGAGKESFNIISQGSVGDIINSKPEDRRSIIESAAGVLKYKKRKEETNRKLTKVNDNLEKINLIINEISTNLEPLKEQSQRATKYVEYQKELENIEIAIIAKDITSLSEENKALEKTITVLNEEILNCSTSSNEKSAKLEQMKLVNIKLDEKIASINEQVIKLNEEISKLNSQKQLTIERKKYEVDSNLLNNNILNLKEEVLKLNNNIESLKKEIDLAEEKFNNQNTKYMQKRSEYQKLAEEKRKLNVDLEIKTKDNFQLTNKIEILEENIVNDTKLPYAVRSILNNPRLQGIHSTIGKLIEVEEKYTLAIDTILGYSSNIIVVDDQISAKKAIEYLKENRLGRATFFPLNIIKPKTINSDVLNKIVNMPGFIGPANKLVSCDKTYQNIIDNQLGNVLVVENIDCLNNIAKLLNYTYRIVTLDGEVSHTGGALSGGTSKNSSNSILILKEELNELQNKKQSSNKLLEELNKKNNQLSEQTDKLYKYLEENAQELNILKEEVHRKNISLKDLEITYENKNNELKGTQNVQENKLDDELNEILELYYQKMNSKEILDQDLENLKKEKNELFFQINELEKENKEQNSDYNQKMQQLKAAEIKSGKNDVLLDNLLNSLSETYNMTYEKAKNNYSLDIPEDTARMNISKLKKQIHSLGNVNLGSIEEYERINTRYTFLEGQKNDLEESIISLQNAINEMDEIMKEKFLSTFNLIDQEFSTVYKKLFKGGIGRLKLTEPENLLETGIEIIAEPPGKKMNSIGLLSGGEKTLTAIALLFAILNVKPVPFVILDEVEAALDEANVETFGKYLKEKKERSQFIIITHKKKTMEYADTLYGITMQESGVSKLVSVKLENL